MSTELLLDRYEILETIGRGGSSEIIKAFDRRMERVVAIKVIPSNKKTAQRALREARTVALLNHPNIVTLYEFDETDDFYYLIMEYLEGISLEDFLADRAPLDTELAVAIAIQVCQALESAHLNDVIHRDIKPANLMLMPDGRVKVMDFGVSRLKDTPATKEGGIAGTFTYMSPEQAGGELVDERSDVWSIGVVLYEMLCGANPFNADTPAGAVMKIMNSQPAPLPQLNHDVGAQLGTAVLKALKKYPADRYDLATDFRYKLERYRQSSRSPKAIVREAVGELTPAPPIDPNTRPITYLRAKLTPFLDKYNPVLARLGVFGALAASAGWFAVKLNGLSVGAATLPLILGGASLVFILGLIFPRIGLIGAGFFISAAVAIRSIPAGAATLILFGTYWYLPGRKRPQAAALPFISPLLAAIGVPYAYPMGLSVIAEPSYAPLLAALGYLTAAGAEILLNIHYNPPFSPASGQILSRLINPAVIWQMGSWVLAAGAGSFLSKGNSLWARAVAITLSASIILAAYRIAPAYIGLPQPISPAVMQPMAFSFIIVLCLLLIFYPRDRVKS